MTIVLDRGVISNNDIAGNAAIDAFQYIYACLSALLSPSLDIHICAFVFSAFLSFFYNSCVIVHISHSSQVSIDFFSFLFPFSFLLSSFLFLPFSSFYFSLLFHIFLFVFISFSFILHFGYHFFSFIFLFSFSYFPFCIHFFFFHSSFWLTFFYFIFLFLFSFSYFLFVFISFSSFFHFFFLSFFLSFFFFLKEQTKSNMSSKEKTIIFNLQLSLPYSIIGDSVHFVPIKFLFSSNIYKRK
ncbi:unnamed protein product [Acanthosepion pharaonis]|uniref:Uncharacterized protein n=1 Tax=Acanthosepion pharaonis TaxID=158019 RepID=A0A812E3U4_ACAPH|nr:unnamed protein product [Sepia pharaonis]